MAYIKESPIRSRQRVYVDIDQSFEPHPNSGDVTRKIDLNAVKQSVRNILLTNKGEKLFDPNFGCNLRGYLFENYTLGLAATIRAAIRYNLSNYEPRISLDNIEVSDDSDNNALMVTVEYTIASPARSQDTVSIVLQRLR